MNKLPYQSFEQIYRKYNPIITYKIIKEIGKVTPDWEDVKAEIYLSLVKTLNSSSFRGDCKVGTLVYIIVQRRITDFMRFKYKTKERLENLKFYYQEEVFPNPEQSFMEKEDREILRLRIQKLRGWRQKQVIKLYLFGMSIVEISRQLESSSSNIGECLDRIKMNIGNLYNKEI